MCAYASLLYADYLFQVKSFIETQKALLTEIQNGCRRNFVLAKEKEERLQQSVSMAEIACAAEEEESNTAAEENSLPSEETSNAPENATPKDDEEITPAPDPQGQDSDSDTEEEAEEEAKEEVEEEEKKEEKVEEKPIVAETRPVAETKPLENSVPRPPGQVAVSSPGRGHKIFLVTRVENPNTQDIKGSSMAGVASPGGPSLANGPDPQRDKMTTCCDNKGMHKPFSWNIL